MTLFGPHFFSIQMPLSPAGIFPPPAEPVQPSEDHSVFIGTPMELSAIQTGYPPTPTLPHKGGEGKMLSSPPVLGAENSRDVSLPTNTDPRIRNALSAINRARDYGRRDDVVSAYENLIDVEREVWGSPNPYTLCQFGIYFRRMGRIQKSIEIFRKALGLKEHPRTWYELSVALEAKGFRDDALSAIENAIRMEENSQGGARALSIFFKACLLRKTSRLEEAERHFREALAMEKGKFSRTWYELAITLSRMKRFDEAIAAAQSGIRLRKRMGIGYARIAHIYFLQKRFDEALETIREGMQKDPIELKLHELRSLILRKMGFPEKALKAIRHGLKMGPKSVLLNSERIVVLVQLGQRDEALDALRALKSLLDRSDITTLMGLGLRRQGDDPEGSIAFLEILAELHPEEAAQITPHSEKLKARLAGQNQR